MTTCATTASCASTPLVGPCLPRTTSTHATRHQARILTTNINFDDGTCSIDLLRSVAEEFSLKLADADALIRDVAQVTGTWRDAARRRGAAEPEIRRMEGAFEHAEYEAALTL